MLELLVYLALRLVDVVGPAKLLGERMRRLVTPVSSVGAAAADEEDVVIVIVCCCRGTGRRALGRDGWLRSG
jgi:hypothetical protein